MRRAAVPKALQERLGDEATDALVELFNKQQEKMTDDIVRAVVRELEPRFARIEARLDLCATKDDLRNFATKDDLRDFATKDDLRNFATKDDLRNFATKDDLRNFATKDDLRDFATKDDLRDFATKDDMRNVATKDDMRAFASRDDLRGFATEAALRETRDDLVRAIERVDRRFDQLVESFANHRTDMVRWMFIFWVGQAFVVLAYFRVGQYLGGG